MQKKHILGRLEISRKCNQNCLFCSAPPTEEERSFEEIKQKIMELKDLGINDIMLTGGEPTLRKDLLDIISFCSKLEFPLITIQTNGSNLDNLDILKEIKKHPEVKFNISFHSYDPEIFSKISQKPENYKKLLTGLKYVDNLKIPAFFTIVINKLNYKSLKKHIMFIKRNFPSIPHLSFNFVDPVYHARDNKWIVPSLAESEKYIHEAVDFIKQNNMTFRIEKLPLCYMSSFEEFSTDIRRVIFDENRIISFLRVGKERKNPDLVVQKKSDYLLTSQCKQCFLNKLCPGLNPNYVSIHGYKEIYPVFENPLNIIKRAHQTRN